jgi:hypothetical protein
MNFLGKNLEKITIACFFLGFIFPYFFIPFGIGATLITHSELTGKNRKK